MKGPGTKCNHRLSPTTSVTKKRKEKKKKAICRGIFEPVIVVRAICQKDFVQRKSCNGLITYRWNSIKSVRYTQCSTALTASRKTWMCSDSLQSVSVGNASRCEDDQVRSHSNYNCASLSHNKQTPHLQD